MTQRDLYYLSGIAILFIAVIVFFNYWQDAKAVGKQKDSVIAEKNATINYWTNKNGRTVAQKEAAELRAKDLAEAYPGITEALKKDFDIKLKNLKAYIQNEFEARGTGTGTVTNNHYYDSITKTTVRYRDFNMDDGYLAFTNRFLDSVSTSSYQYTYRDTARTAIHGKKKWLFGNEQLYSTTIFSNPNAKITGTTNILVNNHRDKRWGLMIGASYAPFSEQPIQPTITVGYNLFKW